SGLLSRPVSAVRRTPIGRGGRRGSTPPSIGPWCPLASSGRSGGLAHPLQYVGRKTRIGRAVCQIAHANDAHDILLTVEHHDAMNLLVLHYVRDLDNRVVFEAIRVIRRHDGCYRGGPGIGTGRSSADGDVTVCHDTDNLSQLLNRQKTDIGGPH